MQAIEAQCSWSWRLTIASTYPGEVGMGWQRGIAMASAAAYDEIADWYEDEFLPRTAAAGADVLGIERALREPQ